jgi:hypothetical protein
MGGGSGCDAKGFLWGSQERRGGAPVLRLDPAPAVGSDQGTIFKMRPL